MSASELVVVAVLYPKVGKTDRVIELLTEITKYVEANEPGVLRYQVHRDLRAAKDGTEDVVMFETYKDKAAFQAHGSSARFRAFQQQLAKEDLMRAPMMLKIVTSKAGFASRL